METLPRRRPWIRSSPDEDSSNFANQNSSGNPKKRRAVRWTLDEMHLRWLIDASSSSKLLGQGGRMLRYLRTTSNTNPPSSSSSSTGSASSTDLDVWISPHVPNMRYRVFNAIGPAKSLAKLTGILVRVMHDESENEPSGLHSRNFDLLLLLPQAIMGHVVGTKRQNLRDIENKSAARLIPEPQVLPGSDDRVIHVYGVADAVHIAVYYIADLLAERGPVMVQNHGQYDPRDGDVFIRPLCQRDPRLDALRSYDYTSDPEQESLPLSRQNSRAGSQSGSYPLPQYGSISASRLDSPLDSRPGSGETSGPEAGSSDTIISTGNDQETKPVLPNLDSQVPQPLRTAYEAAKVSRQPRLRQVVRLSSSNRDLREVFDNIRRVTEAAVQLIEDTDTSGQMLLEVSGPPEENTLALYLVYRCIR